MISFNLARIQLFLKFCGNIPSIFLNLFRDFIASTYFSVCFSKAFPEGEYIKFSFFYYFPLIIRQYFVTWKIFILIIFSG